MSRAGQHPEASGQTFVKLHGPVTAGEGEGEADGEGEGDADGEGEGEAGAGVPTIGVADGEGEGRGVPALGHIEALRLTEVRAIEVILQEGALQKYN